MRGRNQQPLLRVIDDSRFVVIIKDNRYRTLQRVECRDRLEVFKYLEDMLLAVAEHTGWTISIDGVNRDKELQPQST